MKKIKTTKNNAIPKRNAKREKRTGLLIVSALLLIVSLLFAIYAYHTSYQASLTAQADAKVALQRPYSYALSAVFLAVSLLIKGIYNAVIGIAPRRKTDIDIKKLAMAGLMAALCYIGFAFFKIDITVGTERTSFHFGNVFCVLAALLIGGYWGGTRRRCGHDYRRFYHRLCNQRSQDFSA